MRNNTFYIRTSFSSYTYQNCIYDHSITSASNDFKFYSNFIQSLVSGPNQNITCLYSIILGDDLTGKKLYIAGTL